MRKTCSEDPKHTNCDSGTRGIQKENSSTFKHQKKEDPKARQIAKHHQQLKTAKYNGNLKAYQ
jgi:hypothetical protein